MPYTNPSHSGRPPLWERFLVMTPVFLVIFLFLYRSGLSQGQAAQMAAEREALHKLGRLLELPPTATKDDLYVRASIYAGEHDEARKAHIAQQVGLAVSWERIFTRILHLKPAAQSQVARLIAREYSLPENLTLAQMRQYVTSDGRRHVPENSLSRGSDMLPGDTNSRALHGLLKATMRPVAD